MCVDVDVCERERVRAHVHLRVCIRVQVLMHLHERMRERVCLCTWIRTHGHDEEVKGQEDADHLVERKRGRRGSLDVHLVPQTTMCVCVWGGSIKA